MTPTSAQSPPAPSAGDSGGPLLEVEHLSKRFGTGARRGPLGLGRRAAGAPVVAVDDVSFTVNRGETLGIVGESGCGKSTICRAVLRLVEPSSGAVRFDGVDVRGLDEAGLRRLRRRMQIVFQDPFGSLDPRMTALQVVREPLDVHELGSPEERDVRAAQMLELVGIAPAQHRRRPYAFSGGQRQRIGIARAMVIDPELVFLDEPVSALDVSIQAQVLNLLSRLREELHLSYVFIVHDLAVAEYFCDRVVVLYRGAAMEVAASRTLFSAPLHPYTASLLSAVPVPDPAVARGRRRLLLSGQVTPRAVGATGCRFRDRCPVGHDRERCAAVEPPLAPSAEGHLVACHYPGEILSSNRDLAGEEVSS
jgi:oligopeptide/dipeptide ABC transporter ATP-binding protein